MKKPLIDQFDRVLLRDYPDTLRAKMLRLMLANAYFKREITRTIRRNR